VHDTTPTSASRARQGTLGVATLIGLLLTGAVLAACSSSPSSSATTTSGASATTSGGSATTASTSSSSSGGGSSDASKIQSLSSTVQAGEHATFKAVYTTHSTTAPSQTITIEQMPPKSVFGSTSGSVINDGTHTYFCSSSSGQEQCVSESGAAGNPLASITAIFSPATVLSEFQAAQSAAAAHALGYGFAFSSETYAGVPTKCVNFTHAAQTVKYCVTDSGILAYASSAGNTFELTSYTSSPAASDFAVPSGATVITVPSVPGQ
jgi:hypothetical protein